MPLCSRAKVTKINKGPGCIFVRDFFAERWDDCINLHVNSISVWFMNTQIKDYTALVPTMMALHNKTNSSVCVWKIYSLVFVSLSPALLSCLCSETFILRVRGHERSISLSSVPSHPAINCHVVTLLVIKRKKMRFAKYQIISSNVGVSALSLAFVGGHDFAIRFIDKMYQYFNTVACNALQIESELRFISEPCAPVRSIKQKTRSHMNNH